MVVTPIIAVMKTEKKKKSEKEYQCTIIYILMTSAAGMI